MEAICKQLRIIRAENKVDYERIKNIAGTIENPTKDPTMDIIEQAYRRAPSPTSKIHDAIIQRDDRIAKGSRLLRDWARKQK